MESWLSSMDWFERIYWFVALPFSVIFIIQLLLSFFSGDGMTGADFDGDLGGDLGDGSHDAHSHIPGFFSHVLTVQNFVTFFTIFGWSGIASIHSGAPKWVTLLLSILLGLIAMFTIAGLFYFFARMVESGTLQIKKSIGAVGEVYIPIKGARGNIGKIQVSVQGTMREMSAMTDDPADLSTKTVVRVVDIINQNILLVQKA
jgi:membrane protein implicated in regulation of membrane protease activity